MKKATSILKDYFLKIADSDGDDSGSTSALTDICHYKAPSEEVLHGLRASAKFDLINEFLKTASELSDEDKETVRKFKEVVNMSPTEIKSWLDNDLSHGVGQNGIGRSSGHKIIEILNKNAENYTSADITHMNKVISYVARHKGEGPLKDDNGDLTNSVRSLKNWGHNPLKKSATKNAPKDSPQCGAVCKLRWSGLSEGEAMAYWRKEQKASLKTSQALLRRVLGL